ncbi:cytochrome P450 [Xylaria sp. FL1777]|nr:cytochrome P450 [Xylaria sp. FL1777]
MEAIAPVIAVVAGVTSHLAFFRVGEHHLYSSRYVLAAVSAFAISIAVHSLFFELSSGTAALRTLAIASSYFGGLYTSLIIYRIFFHPLSGFSGPLGCKISSAWFATYMPKLDAFRQLEKLHQKHGNFLRIGSNDLSITHPKAVPAIFGYGSKCRKADWYDLTYPMISLQSTRDDALHSRWRRAWSTAFGERNLQDYEERMVHYRGLLIKIIEESAGNPLDMTKWFHYYNYDVMGELAFGRSFDMLEATQQHEAIKLYLSGTAVLGFKLPMWFFRLVVSIPGMTKNWWGFMGYCVSQLDSRIKRKGVEKKDIIGNLLNQFSEKGPTGVDRMLLEGDTQLIIVAGSDTVSTTLTSIFRYLAQHPHHIGLLRAEIDPLQPTARGDYIYTELTNLRHLNGVINEALRLFPPVPTVIPRITPPEGLDIDGTFIPGNTTVFCPQYVIGRSSDSFASPNEFIPERWYSRPELIRDASSYSPFSAGSYNCVGRPLALLNIREVVARIIANYDIRSTPAETLRAYDEGMQESFTLAPPELKLSFVKRQVSGSQ